MNILIIITAALAAASATFAALFLTGRGEARRQESRAEGLAGELTDLRYEMARMEARNSDALLPLTKEKLVDYLRKEQAEDAEAVDDEAVAFTLLGARYHFFCDRLPRQLVLRKGFNVKADAAHWDVVEKAAREVTDSLVMIKMSVTPGESYDYMIVSTDRTVDSLRQNFPTYMSIFNEAEKMFGERYWAILEEEHPEECKGDEEEEEDESAQTDEKSSVWKLLKDSHPSKMQS